MARVAGQHLAVAPEAAVAPVRIVVEARVIPGEEGLALAAAAPVNLVATTPAS
ncbi:MAG TPA: hypothetical protein VFW33_07445 [Gemmataceae bacterium]|nr:hypothetical protein [Gemmataceae bacterium]